jgi:amino acid adenylation domain-containing protein
VRKPATPRPSVRDSLSAVVRCTEQSMARCFEAQVLAAPARLAVSSNLVQTTYGELNCLANRQAHALLASGIRPQEPVAILVEQGVPFIAALLAVLKAGGCFVPLDPANPPARNAQVLQDTDARRLITNSNNRSSAQAVAAQHCEVLDLDALPCDLATHNPELAIAPTALACVLYTSGSTGQPKGVMHDHRSLLHNSFRHHEAFLITPEDRQTLLYTCGVYGGVRDIFNALLCGASLHTFSVKRHGVQDLCRWLRESQITIYCSVATVFRQFAATLTGREDFPQLRLIKLGGEATNRSDVELYRAYFPATCLLHCGLGATETGVVRHFFVGHQTRFDGDIVPLGYPLEGVEVLLADEHGSPVAPGSVGEIMVRSRYIAHGYWRRPDLSGRAFSSDPVDADIRTYRTGDLGILDGDGCLRHLGRKDSQVKIRGYRIELAEIEAAVSCLEGVRHAVVALHRDSRNEACLVAYFVAANDRMTTDVLRSAVAQRLPDYMIPTVFVQLDQLPQTPNGKVDRLALPPPDSTRPRLAQRYIAPHTALERNLVAIWADILGLQQIGVDDDFFDLGGNSMVAVRMMAQIRMQHGRTLPLALLFRAGTIRKLALVIAQGHEETAWSPLVPIRPGGRRTPLFCIHPGGGNVLGYQEFASYLDEDQPVYGIQAYGVVTGQNPHTNVPDMARRYLQVIRETQPHGPYYLGGESFGGLVAYEIACILVQAGERVAFLFLGDVWSAGVPDSHPLAYALACATYPLTLSWRDWRELLARKFRRRGRERVPTKRYTYADELHRRNSVAHRQASHSFCPQPYPGKVTLFRASEQDHRTRRLQHYFGGPHMGWRAVAGSVEVHWMPDMHHEMMHSANSRGFARLLQECLVRASRGIDEHGAGSEAAIADPQGCNQQCRRSNALSDTSV